MPDQHLEREPQEQSRFGTAREFVSTALDALLAAWLGDVLAFSGALPKVSGLVHGLKKSSDLVLESHQAFNRTIYHRHQELEFAVPYAETLALTRRFVQLYEELYPSGLPYTAFELRFTPEGHQRSLIGPGRDRRSTWIDIITNDTAGFERYFEAAEELMMEVGGRPHLGKYSEKVDHHYMRRVHGRNFDRFRQLVAEYDPAGKFVNAFTRRLFGLEGGSEPSGGSESQ